MEAAKQEQIIAKEQVLADINRNGSALQRYQDFFVGSPSFGDWLKYELATMLIGGMPGALGLFLRKQFYPSLFKRVGSGVVLGRNITLRHPGRISLGERVAIDDECLLDAKGSGDGGIIIGNDVLIARNTIVQTKGNPVVIGDHCVIGSQSQIASVGGIKLGNHVMISGQVYIGGGRYKTDDVNTPMMKQALYSKGPVVIEDDVWIGAGAVIQDGVRIGRGSVIGAGAVVQNDVPEFTVAVPQQRLVLLPRNKEA